MNQAMTSTSERANPRDAARAMTTSGRFHDVVVAASKVMHSQELEDRDMASLRWARDQLREAGSKDVIFAMPSANRLTGPRNAVLALRRAVRPSGGDPGDTLNDLRAEVDAVLRGKRDQPAIEAMQSLRQLFSRVSRFLLQTEIASHDDSIPGRLWALSTTTLHS